MSALSQIREIYDRATRVQKVQIRAWFRVLENTQLYPPMTTEEFIRAVQRNKMSKKTDNLRIK